MTTTSPSENVTIDEPAGLMKTVDESSQNMTIRDAAGILFTGEISDMETGECCRGAGRALGEWRADELAADASAMSPLEDAEPQEDFEGSRRRPLLGGKALRPLAADTGRDYVVTVLIIRRIP
jgi:hypothetical protein